MGRRPAQRPSNLEDIRTRPSDFDAFPRLPFPRAFHRSGGRPDGRFSRRAGFGSLIALILVAIIVLFAFDVVGDTPDNLAPLTNSVRSNTID